MSQCLFDAETPEELQACRYLVINSGTSQSPEFTRQRDRYACGALAALRPFIFKSPTGLKNNTTTMADAFSDALYFSCGKTSGLRLPGTTRLGVPPSLARSAGIISPLKPYLMACLG